MEQILYCPHCKSAFIMEKINCGIFRHGIYKKDEKQLDPHSSKEVCDKVTEENIIYGCGKPFQIVQENDCLIVKKCGYI